MTKRPKNRPSLRAEASRLKRWFDKCRQRDARLKAKYANDPKHKHTREEVGRVGPVEGGFAVALFWCQQCHADLGHKLVKVPRRQAP